MSTSNTTDPDVTELWSLVHCALMGPWGAAERTAAASNFPHLTARLDAMHEDEAAGRGRATHVRIERDEGTGLLHVREFCTR